MVKESVPKWLRNQFSEGFKSKFQKHFQKCSEIEVRRGLKFHKSSTVWVESEWNGGLWGGNV